MKTQLSSLNGKPLAYSERVAWNDEIRNQCPLFFFCKGDSQLLDPGVFQQDGVRYHYARTKFFRIGALCVQDLDPIKPLLFAWGFIKSEAHRRKIQDVSDFRNRIMETVPRCS
jgi:hypothetical protein